MKKSEVKSYSFLKGLKKTLICVIIIAGPILLEALPSDVANLTVSGILLMILNWAKVKYPSSASVL